MMIRHPLLEAFATLRDAIQVLKPNDRSSLDRAYAVLLTMVEQAEAYAGYFIVQVEAKSHDS